MPSEPDEPSSIEDPLPAADWPSHPEIEGREGRNLLLLAAHQIVLRIGWIFKTESVIIPAFLDHVAGAGWIRGCLPVLNRLGQSVPPVFCADHFSRLRRKKRGLAMLTMLMSLPFGMLSVVWFATGGHPTAWMPGLFLALYFLFFVFKGLYDVSFGTVQGKLIRPTRRGRLLLTSTFWGTPPAVLLAWWLLDQWLAQPKTGYGYIFTFAAVGFFLAGLVPLVLFEPLDVPSKKARIRGSLATTLRVLRADANLWRLVVVGMTAGSGSIIIIHYQALARDRLGLEGAHLMVWVIALSASVGVFSLFVGPLADRRGNRLAMRILIFGSALPPLMAISFPQLPGHWGAALFWTVYVPLGVSPLILRTVLNYTLEICEPAEHARYLSIVSLGAAVPFVFSPAVGGLVDAVGFEPVFAAVIVLIVLGGFVTFWLEEPRHRIGDEAGALTLATPE